MQEAVKLALQAAHKDEVPIGAVIVHEGRMIARAHNQVEMLKDPTAHAEMIALTQATNTLSCKWLYDCDLYVTLEPCAMCAGALVLARVKRIFFGAPDSKTGACGTVMDIARNQDLNHQIEVYGGLEREQCGAMLSDFFQKKREQGKSG